MNIDQAFPSKYIKSSDLGSQDQTYTIKRVTLEKLGQGANIQTKPVLYFNEVEKGFACNKTNANTIGKLYGKPIKRFIVVECKTSKNKDGSAQVRKYTIDFTKFTDEFLRENVLARVFAHNLGATEPLLLPIPPCPRHLTLNMARNTPKQLHPCLIGLPFAIPVM